MEIKKKYLKNGQYITDITPKYSIILHHTCGATADGAISWWDQTPDRVGCPFVIDRDGTIYETFDPSMWAFHIGLNNDDNYFEKHAISIELVALGELYEEKGQYYFYPLGYPNPIKKRVVPGDEVIKLKTAYKGKNLFHAYTEAQIVALGELITYCVDKFNIELPDKLGDIFSYNPDVANKHINGLFGHGVLRKDKNDIFPQPSLISALNNLFKDREKGHVKKP